jgi:hypothetical protein
VTAVENIEVASFYPSTGNVPLHSIVVQLQSRTKRVQEVAFSDAASYRRNGCHRFHESIEPTV